MCLLHRLYLYVYVYCIFTVVTYTIRTCNQSKYVSTVCTSFSSPHPLYTSSNPGKKRPLEKKPQTKMSPEKNSRKKRSPGARFPQFGICANVSVKHLVVCVGSPGGINRWKLKKFSTSLSRLCGDSFNRECFPVDFFIGHLFLGISFRGNFFQGTFVLTK